MSNFLSNYYKTIEVEKEAEKVISITSEKIEKLAKKFSNE